MSVKYLILISFLFVNSAFSLAINEAFLKKSFDEQSPLSSFEEVKALSSELSYSSFDDQFTTRAYWQAQYLENKEKQLNAFIPVTSPSKSLEIGVKKNTLYGTSFKLGAFTQQYTNSFLRRSTTSGLKASIALDLYKDIFGRSSRSRFSGLEYEARWKSMEAKASQKALFNQVRKIYFSLLANAESEVLVNELIKTSQKQVSSSRERYKNKVADVGEVSKYQSQLAARKAQKLGISHERELLFRSLKELLPSLRGKMLSLAPFDEQSISNNILACTSEIFSNKLPPLKYSLYDEIAKLAKESGEYKSKAAKSLDAPDLKLIADYQSSGKALGYSDSIDDFSDDKRSSYSIGLSFSLPLNFSQRKSSDIQEILERKYAQAKSEQNLSKVESLHQQTVQSISYLNEVLKEQGKNSLYLKKSLETMNKKFKQARVSVEQLVAEQDLYQQSRLSEIETKLILVHTLLDYLSVYDSFPCSFNRINI